MTTIAVWKTFEHRWVVGNPAIWMISDSRASKANMGNTARSVLIDRCAKLFELDIRVSTGRNDAGEPVIKRSTIAVAVAGSTLIAHNVVLHVQAALRKLVGDAPPQLEDVASYIARIASDLTAEASAILLGAAQCELIVVAADPENVRAFSVRPEAERPTIYSVAEIAEFPYITGSDKAEFAKALRNELESRPEISQEQLDQAPLRVFDRLFFSSKAADATGGELQIMTIGPDGVQQVRPMRWDASRNQFTTSVLGMEFQEKIGGCVVGAWPYPLDDL